MTNNFTSSKSKIHSSTEVRDVELIIQLLEQSGVSQTFISPMGLLLLLTIFAIIWVKVLGGNTSKGNKHKLARAKWARRREKRNARNIASKQIEGRRHNEVALYISRTKVAKPLKVDGKYLIHIPKSAQRIYLPDANRGALVCGAPGSGKTYSFITPALRSSIDQGFPIILYDNKYNLYKSQTAKIAGYAIERGYKVSVLAPGFAESTIANPLDLLKDETDAAMARQLAVTLNKNLKLGDGDKDSFFTNAGDLLTQAVFQLAKVTSYPDILMCYVILSLDNLALRIQNAELNLWVKSSFSQFLSVAKSDRTAANITGTTLGLFTRFLIPELLSVFCGQTDLPLKLKGRQMVVFGMDDEKRDVISPLVASVLHLLATLNLARQRTSPLILSLDELPTIYLPSLEDWLNQKRENGLVGILGVQNLSQLEKSYGDKGAETIFTGCMTKAFFNPGSSKAAENYSKYLGREEVVNKRQNRNINVKGGINSDASKDIGQRNLFEASQFNTLKKGRAVIINPGFQSGNLAALPLLESIKLSPITEKHLEKRSVSKWHEYKEQLTKNSKIQQITEKDLQVRLEEANNLLPLLTQVIETEETRFGY